MIVTSFEICNKRNSFHNNIEKIKCNLIKNVYLPFLINKVIKKYLDQNFSSNENHLKDISDVYCFKSPYIGNFVKKKFNIKLVFYLFKVKIIFHTKIETDDLKSFLVFKFTCATCSSSYTGKTYRHFKTRIKEHIEKDSKSHVFKHLNFTTTCFDLYNCFSFKIIDKGNCKFDFKIKEALHINLRKSKLNAQQNHLAVTRPL